jgi:putative oxidoreductase
MLASMDFGLLLIHVTVGALVAAHGTQKLFGWFGGRGLEGTGTWMETIGLHPGRPMAFAAGATEFTGGLLLALGLFTPLGAAMIASMTIVAARTVSAGKGLWNEGGGWEYVAVLGVIAIGLAFNGAGAWSLDAATGWNVAGTWWGIGATAAALVGAMGVLTIAARMRRSAARSPEVAPAS